MQMKKVYLKLMLAEPKPKKAHDDKVKSCNEDLTKARKNTTRVKKPTIQKKYVEKDIFD